jgi:hypothetical protein
MRLMDPEWFDATPGTHIDQARCYWRTEKMWWDEIDWLIPIDLTHLRQWNNQKETKEADMDWGTPIQIGGEEMVNSRQSLCSCCTLARGRS